MFFNFDEAIKFLEKQNHINLGLETIKKLLNYLGNPEKQLKFIHIAGTNGKGACLTYISEVLLASGYSVGRFSSPAVFCENETIWANGKNITDKEFVNVMNRVSEAISAMESDGLRVPTRFEIETAASFLFFFEKKVEIVVLETGLGGRLDATNVVSNKIATVFTKISYDHMGILGNTLDKIAQEKAGIMHQECMAISTYQNPKVSNVLKRYASQHNINIQFAGKGKCIRFDLDGQQIMYKDEIYYTSLLGENQLQNLPLAVDTLNHLKNIGYKKISKASILAGIREAKIDGRFEIISKNPLVILDGAHNESASKVLSETLRKHFNSKKKIFVMGIFRDKDYKAVVKNMVPYADKIFTFDWKNSRSLCGKSLAEIVYKYNRNVEYAGDISNAIKCAMRLAGKDSMVLAFGSLSHLKEVKSLVQEVQNG